MNTYPDNFIGEELDEMDIKMRKEYPKAEGWLPFETYDLVQCGYPYPDHGEMIIRPDGGTNYKEELLPPHGQWVKASDVREYLRIINCKHKNTWNDHGIEICKDCGKQLEVTSFRD